VDWQWLYRDEPMAARRGDCIGCHEDTDQGAAQRHHVDALPAAHDAHLRSEVVAYPMTQRLIQAERSRGRGTPPMPGHTDDKPVLFLATDRIFYSPT
jgi:hypothetical protein